MIVYFYLNINIYLGISEVLAKYPMMSKVNRLIGNVTGILLLLLLLSIKK